MGTCSARGCCNRKFPGAKIGVTFHRFPKDKIRCRKWLKALNKPNWIPTENSLLCSEHFRPEDIDRNSYNCVVLKKDAVPCIFLNDQSVESNQTNVNNSFKYDESLETDEFEIEENSQEYLICLIEAFPILFDKSDPDFYNEEKVAETWGIISNIVDLPVEDCQTEWHTLLVKYKVQRQIILDYEARGQKAKSLWPLYDSFYRVEKVLQKSNGSARRRKRQTSQENNFASHSNGFEMNPETPSKIFKTENGKYSNASEMFRDNEYTGETNPPITDINEDIQFVNSLLPILVRMKEEKKTQCKKELITALRKYENTDKL